MYEVSTSTAYRERLFPSYYIIILGAAPTTLGLASVSPSAVISVPEEPEINVDWYEQRKHFGH